MFRVTILQQILPVYRVPFFEALAQTGQMELHLFYDDEFMGHQSHGDGSLVFTRVGKAPIKKLISRFYWQNHPQILGGLKAGDILVVSGSPWFLSNYYLIWKARRKGIGVVWWGQGFSTTTTRTRLILKRILMKMAHTWILYTSEETARFKQFGFDPHRLFAAENTMDTQAIRDVANQWDSGRLAQFKEREGISNRSCLLFCSRLIPKTKLHLLMDILPDLIKQHPSTLLLIIGDGPLKQELQKRAEEDGTQDAIRFLGAIHAEDQLAPWFLSSEAFVYPGAVGLSILHGLSYGLPMVLHGTRSEHGPEFAAFQDGVNGFSFKEDQAPDFLEKILSILKDPALRDRLSDGALETVEKRFNMKIMVGNFMKAFQKTREMVALVKGNKTKL